MASSIDSEKVGVAVVNHICPICGKVNDDDSTVVINKRFTNSEANKVKSLHNKTVGVSRKPCKECQSWIDKGAFFVIGVDVEKTEDMANPYRSGHLVGVKRDCDFYKSLPDECKRGDAILMDYRQMMQLGFIQK